MVEARQGADAARELRLLLGGAQPGQLFRLCEGQVQLFDVRAPPEPLLFEGEDLAQTDLANAWAETPSQGQSRTA